MQFFKDDAHGGFGQMRTQAMMTTKTKTQMRCPLSVDIEFPRIFEGIGIVIRNRVHQIHQVTFSDCDAIDFDGAFGPLGRT